MKSTRLSLRIPPDLRASLEAKAKAAGLPIGRYMKRASSEAKVTTIITSEISRDQWVELGAALIALRSAAKLLESRKGEGAVATLQDLVLETCIHLEGIRGLLLAANHDHQAPPTA